MNPSAGGAPDQHVSESSNYRPGEPLRLWDSGESVVAVDAELLIKAAGAGVAIKRLIDQQPLTLDDELAFGRLNSHCVLRWYEPMVMLIDRPRIHPALPDLLRDHTKVLNG